MTETKKINNTLEKKSIFHEEIYGIKFPLFLIILLPAFTALYMDLIPINIVTSLMIMMGLGGLLIWIGNVIPIFFLTLAAVLFSVSCFLPS